MARFVRKVQLSIAWSLRNSRSEPEIVGGFVEENPDISDLSSKLMLLLAKDVEKSGALFAITAIPSKYRLRNRNRGIETIQYSDKWKEWANAYQVKFFDLTAGFEREAAQGRTVFFDQNIHFNENGHRVVAQELGRELSDIFQEVGVSVP
ncbi:MAG TPA: SGNH/GDSL hydrolase family protein [Chromatiaceae bacterium]|nr:SGNH/GDSL hydrolase family protein [Chromatiaceae bacterium]